MRRPSLLPLALPLLLATLLAPPARAQATATPLAPSVEALWALLGSAHGLAVDPAGAREVLLVATWRGEVVLETRLELRPGALLRLDAGAVRHGGFGRACPDGPAAFALATAAAPAGGALASSGVSDCLGLSGPVELRSAFGLLPAVPTPLPRHPDAEPAATVHAVPPGTWLAFAGVDLVADGAATLPDDPATALLFFLRLEPAPGAAPPPPTTASWDEIRRLGAP